MSRIVTAFVVAILSFSVFVSSISAQEEPEPTPITPIISNVESGEVVVCFASDLQGIEPYAITFQNVNLDDNAPLFGLIFPSSGSVTVSSQLNVIGAVYSIRPDQMTGGYTSGDFISIANTSENIPIAPDNDPCRTEFLSTVPMRISEGHMLAIQRGTGNNFGVPVMRSVFAFYFEETGKPGFQLVQFNRDENIDVTFPFLTEDTDNRFLVITNRFAQYGQSTLNTVTGETIINTSDMRDRITVENNLMSIIGRGLYDVMNSTNIRVYPYCGVFETYMPGSYIRLAALDANAVENRFTPDTNIVSVRGNGSFPYAIQSQPNEVNGTIQPANQPATFARFTDDGLMIAATSSGDVIVLEDHWFMESANYQGCIR